MHASRRFVTAGSLILAACTASSAYPSGSREGAGKNESDERVWVTVPDDVRDIPCGREARDCPLRVRFHELSIPEYPAPGSDLESVGEIRLQLPGESSHWRLDPDDFVVESWPTSEPRKYYRLPRKYAEGGGLTLSQVRRFAIEPILRVDDQRFHCRPLHALRRADGGSGREVEGVWLRSVACAADPSVLAEDSELWWVSDRVVLLDYELQAQIGGGLVSDSTGTGETSGSIAIGPEVPLRLHLRRVIAPASRDAKRCHVASDERHRNDRRCAWDPEGTIVADPDEWRADLRVAVTVVKEPIEQALDVLDRRYTLDGYRGAEYHGAENSWDKPDGRVRGQSHPNNSRFDVWDWTELGTDVELSPSGLTLQAMQEGRVFLEFSDVDSLGDELMNRCYFRLRGEGDDSEGYVEPIDGSGQYRAVCKAGTGLGGGDIVITLEIEPGD